MVVVVLFNAGLQFPVIPFKDFVVNGDNIAPEQIAATVLNIGVMTDVIVTSSAIVVVAHFPASGVKVYVTVPIEDVLIVAGFQVPGKADCG